MAPPTRDGAGRWNCPVMVTLPVKNCSGPGTVWRSDLLVISMKGCSLLDAAAAAGATQTMVNRAARRWVPPMSQLLFEEAGEPVERDHIHAVVQVGVAGAWD